MAGIPLIVGVTGAMLVGEEFNLDMASPRMTYVMTPELEVRLLEVFRKDFDLFMNFSIKLDFEYRALLPCMLCLGVFLEIGELSVVVSGVVLPEINVR